MPLRLEPWNGEGVHLPHAEVGRQTPDLLERIEDRKSTRLNSSHSQISYAVFCLKKKKLERDAGQEKNTEIKHETVMHLHTKQQRIATHPNAIALLTTYFHLITDNEFIAERPHDD